MDFFAIVGGQQLVTYRMEFDRPLQEALTRALDLQAEELVAPHIVEVPFASENFRPDETEVLVINPFDLPAHIHDPTENPVGWHALPHDPNLIANVLCIFGYDAQRDRLIFQLIPPQQRLTTSRLSLILRQNAFSRLEDPGLVIGSHVHAVYEGGSLRFKSLFRIKQIFDITLYYNEATDADIDSLAELDAVDVEDIEALKRDSGPWVRTRIAFILASDVLNRFSPRQLSRKAQTFGVTLQVVRKNRVEKLVIPTDRRQLRSVLKFLEEEYFEGPITGIAYETNSRRPINNP